MLRASILTHLDDESVLQAGGEFMPLNCVVLGAACLILGLPVARQLRDRLFYEDKRSQIQ